MVPSNDEATNTVMPSLVPCALGTMRTSEGESIAPIALAWLSRVSGAYTPVTVSG